ncbi:MAG: PTS lactose transporter subunit IIB [Candidatus Promineifilaceae bacterium]
MTQSIAASDVSTIILACEAGMGSSLMVVSQIKRKLKKAKISGVKVMHKPARSVPSNAKLVLVHGSLAKVVRAKAPDAVIVTFKMFLNDPAFKRVVDAFINDGEIVGS